MGKLKKITVLDQIKPLYDIEVEDNHNFVVNDGIVIKNSEQYLSRESVCILASINCENFSPEQEEYEKELSIIGPSINRFLDNVNECELTYGTYATPHQKIAIEKLRRTGAGYTNLAGWLFKKNIPYGDATANNEVEKFTERYNYHLYKSSIELGREKGSFGLFNRSKFEKSPFIQRMMNLGLVFDAMRCVTNSSLAPTGTLSLMFRNCVMSYGIEPAFGMYYWKRTRISGKYEYYFCVPKIVRDTFLEHGLEIPIQSDTVKDTWDGKIGRPISQFIDENKDKIGIKFKNATDISPFDKLDLMAKVMKWIDSSISVTYLLPENTDWKDVYNFILEAHKREIKSIAAFPDKKMYGIVSFVPFKDLAFSLKNEGVEIHEQNFTPEELKEIKITPKSTKIQGNHAPKRPSTLPCDVHHIKVRGEDLFVLVGKYNGDPYEVFAGKNGMIANVKKGEVTKNKRGHYHVFFEDGSIIDNVCDLITDEQAAVTRLASLALRHGADIKYIVDQLEKVPGDMTNFARGIARALKKYVPNGTKISGQSCGSCGSSELIRQDGCMVCCSCGSSKCS